MGSGKRKPGRTLRRNRRRLDLQAGRRQSGERWTRSITRVMVERPMMGWGDTRQEVQALFAAA